MPANTSLMFGTSPPFPSDKSIFDSFHNNNDSYSAGYDLFHNRSCFSRVPTLSLKYPKSCLKPPTKQTNRIGITAKNNIDDEAEFCPNNKINSTKKSKRVRFADCNGGVLALIKHLTEFSYEPPKSLSSKYSLGDLMKNVTLNCAEEETQEHELVLHFTQPVADYSNFKMRLDCQCVCLENLVVVNDKCIQGTVKVKNIAFEKLVFVRITFDEWQTSTDKQCHYVKNSHESSGDTFQFTIQFPSSVNAIQFCILYQTDGREFWDNNDNCNYKITKNNCKTQKQTNPITIPPKPTFPNGRPYPSTYCELPGPEDRTWIPFDNNIVPFY